MVSRLPSLPQLLACVLACLSFAGATTIPLLPVIWHAPFFSGGGYCSEATSFADGLANITRVRIIHHGDSFDADYIRGLPTDLRQRLSALSQAPVAPAHAVSICHSEPGAWAVPTPLYQTAPCPAPDALYTVGRTMFETDRLPRCPTAGVRA